MLKNVQLRTPEKDDYKAAKEVADALKKSKKFDGTKVFLCRQVAGIAVPNGEKHDPYVHSFTFVSNDKDELQKLADSFNKILYPNHEKDELLGVNVRKNTGNYEDVFESADEKQPVEEDLKSDFEKKCVYCKDCKYAHMTYSGETKYCDFFQPDGGDSLYLPAGSFCSNGEKK